MITHLLRITAATACIILCTLLPFLPGRYDTVAAHLSVMSQLFGIVGLLLVPVGVLWMVSERRSRSPGKRYGFAIATLVASSFVWVIVSLAAFASGSLSLGFLVLVLWVYVVSKVWPRLRTLKSATPASASVMPLYLLILPVAVTLLQLALVRRATEFSRSRAIRECAPLIADIEQYRAVHGRYPPSLLSVWKDYRPSIIGIKEYQYELSGEAYNLFFEQFT